MIKRLFGSIIDVRKGEITLTLLMVAYYYLLLVTYYFLKPARDSLFLVQLGPEQLPIVFMLIAVIVVPVTTAYSRASRLLKLNRLINATTLLLIVNLLLLRWLLVYTHASVFYTFYIWVSIYGALSTAQFWLLANGVFDATQAKRLFVLFGLGGIVGAFTGGEVTSLFVNVFNVSTENLLFFCMGFLAICVLLVNVVWRIKQKSETQLPVAQRLRRPPNESYAETFRMVRRSRHLMLIVGIIALTMATASFVDYQFKLISSASFPDKQGLTSFLGKFYGRLSLISFLFQLIVSYRFLRWFGVGGAILLLPLGLLAGTMTMLIIPGLVAGVLLRGADGVFKYSIDKTGRELLFLPVPLEVKKRTKVFIDIFVDRWFRGVAGGVLLLLVMVFDVSVRQLSVVVLVLLAVWLSLVFLMRKEYVNAFRKALERREIDPSDLYVNIADSSTLHTLRSALASSNERQIAYALNMLNGVDDIETITAIKPLLRHPSADVRRAAVTVLIGQDGGDFTEDMRELLADQDPCVRRDALYYICATGDSDRTEALRNHLADSDPKLVAAAVGAIIEYGTPDEEQLIDEPVIEKLLSQSGPESEFARKEAAVALGRLNNPRFKKFLLQLMNDEAPGVISIAMGGAGSTGDRDFIPHLLDHLKDSRHRAAAREALAAYGDRIVGTLSDFIIDPTTSIAVRSNLCRTLSRIPTQHSVDTLVAALNVVEPSLKYHVIKALNSLRARHSDLRFRHDALNHALIEETESYYAILRIMSISDADDNDANRLLSRALKEKIDQNLERMFRLLALVYSQQDMHGAYLGIIGDHKELRASAIEFLDNVLKKEVKKYLFPIVDNISTDFKLQKGQELFGINLLSRVDALKYLLNGRDPWLKACAVFAVRDEGPSEELRELVLKSQQDPHPVVQETARMVLSRT